MNISHLEIALYFFDEWQQDISLNLGVLTIIHEQNMWLNLFEAAMYGEI